jgi:hypothetical protein
MDGPTNSFFQSKKNLGKLEGKISRSSRSRRRMVTVGPQYGGHRFPWPTTVLMYLCLTIPLWTVHRGKLLVITSWRHCTRSDFTTFRRKTLKLLENKELRRIFVPKAGSKMGKDWLIHSLISSAQCMLYFQPISAIIYLIAIVILVHRHKLRYSLSCNITY